MLARVGFPQSAPRSQTICSYTLLDSSKILTLRDTLDDPFYKNHVAVTGAPYVRFYVGANIMVEGMKMGTLCIYDTIPHPQFSNEDEQTMLDICETVSSMISGRRRQLLEEKCNGVRMHQTILTLLKPPLAHVQRTFTHIESLAKKSLVPDVNAQLVSSFVALQEEMTKVGEFTKNLISTISLLENSVETLEMHRCDMIDLLLSLQACCGSAFTVRSHLNCRYVDLPSVDLPSLCFMSLIKMLLVSPKAESFCSQYDFEEAGVVDVTMTADSHLLIYIHLPESLSTNLKALAETSLFQAINELFALIHGRMEVQEEHTIVMFSPCRESTIQLNLNKLPLSTTRSSTPASGGNNDIDHKSGVYCNVSNARSSDNSSAETISC